MPDYVYVIEIDHRETKSNPGPLRICHSESVDGAKHLYKWLKSVFPCDVAMYRDISTIEHKLIAREMKSMPNE